MITPVGMNNSAMGVDRIRGPRHNNGMASTTSFQGFNAQKVQEGAQGFFKTALEYAGKAKNAVIGFFGSETFQKIKDTVVGAVKTVINKAGELFTHSKEKAGE